MCNCPGCELPPLNTCDICGKVCRTTLEAFDHCDKECCADD